MPLHVTWSRSLVVGIGLLAFGCSHEVQSPAVKLPAASPLEPDLVCNAQKTTRVAITGKGFTPMATQTLQEPTVLIVPRLDLERVSDLTGADASAEKLRISGDPRDEKNHADHNLWQSENKMTLVVDEELALEPGIYDLTVTNPDNKHSHKREGALAVLPPPVIMEIKPPAVCVDQSDVELTLIGEHFLEYDGTKPTVTIVPKAGGDEHTYTVHTTAGCAAIPDRSKNAQLCTDVTFTVPMQDLDADTYLVTLKNPAPADCSSTDTIELLVNPPPEVDSVVPANVCSGGSVLVATGKDFQPGATGELRCDGGTVASLAAEVSSTGEQITLTFGPGAQPGDDCDVVVQNPDGCEDRPLPHHTVVATEGPILFYSAPPVAWNGISTQIKLFVTAVEAPFTVSIASDGEAPIELEAIVDPGNARRLQATVPKGTAAGDYDVIVADGTGCSAILPDGLTVTADENITLAAVAPPFGVTDGTTAVTITRSAGTAFTPTPMVFLSPTGSTNDPAYQLSGVTVVDGTTLTALIPSGVPAGTYNLVVVDPQTGSVGVLDDAFKVVANAPPVISQVTPQSIINAADDPLNNPQKIEVRGSHFASGDIELRCEQPDGSSAAPSAVTTESENCTTATDCLIVAGVDGSGLAEGSVCIVRVTNADGSYYDFSAIGVTGPSLNLAQHRDGTDLLVARRGLAAAAVKATAASRFVYAIGGDEGTAAATTPLSSVEFAPVDVFGNMQAWQPNRSALPGARSFAGSATVGRYIYVFGGSDGAAALDTGARALVLSPEETPIIADADLCLSGQKSACFGVADLEDGLEAGTYSYRVAAVIDGSDVQNLGGETLASDPLTLRLPEIDGRQISVKVIWTAPVDALGVELTGITGYRIYRTPKDGVAGSDEQLLAEVADTELSFVDDGSESLDAAKTPLPPGSTSAWQALPVLNTPRSRLQGTAAVNPADATKWHLYALLGKDSGADADGTGAALASYEYLTVTVLGNGRQTVGTWTEPATGFGAARFAHGAWAADRLVASVVPAGETWLYVGGGRDGAGNAATVNGTEAAQVSATGELTGFTSAHATNPSRTGFGTAAAAGRLFVFAGSPPGSPSNNAESFALLTSNTLDNANNEGGLNVGDNRIFMGSALQSAFIFIIGGQDDNTAGTVTNSTALIVQ